MALLRRARERCEALRVGQGAAKESCSTTVSGGHPRQEVAEGKKMVEKRFLAENLS